MWFYLLFISGCLQCLNKLNIKEMDIEKDKNKDMENIRRRKKRLFLKLR